MLDEYIGELRVTLYLYNELTCSCLYLGGSQKPDRERANSRERERREGRERDRGGEKERPWGGLLAVTKLESRKVHGHLKKTSSWSPTSKNMALEIGDQSPQILVIATRNPFFWFPVLLLMDLLSDLWKMIPTIVPISI